ncbi:centrosomal protein of 164 kDa-like isoform X2 [Ischnura elegans]|uniref:centrosomal protein of 164 kDa-like isoform X2 n=1 Tax=Ischnura elegans TaxID=197161 RepID=UPI001ED8ACDA|nr:centrosomal protein of 164 kDa-like isoform X2 [Ischnura elegans]
MTCSPSSRILVCHEVFDESSLPSEEEIKDYAIKIGIDPETEPHLLPIACKGLMEALPPGWKPCYDEESHGYYYYNTRTGLCQWEHPLDEHFRDAVKKSRSESISSAADEDSKTSAKEDLKSFEEAVTSEILPKSMDSIKPGLLSLRSMPKLTSTLSALPEERPSSALVNVKKEKNLMKVPERHPKATKRAGLVLKGGGMDFLRRSPSTSPPEEGAKAVGLTPTPTAAPTATPTATPVTVVVTGPATGEEENYPKSILRDKSPTKPWDTEPRDSEEDKSPWRKHELEEERKSVRFKLEEELLVNFHQPSNNDDAEDVDEADGAVGISSDWNSDDEIREEEEMIAKMKALAAKETTTIQEESEEEEEDEDIAAPPKPKTLVVNLSEKVWSDSGIEVSPKDLIESSQEKEASLTAEAVKDLGDKESSPSEEEADTLNKEKEKLQQEMKDAIKIETEIAKKEHQERIKKLKEEHGRILQKIKRELLEEEENHKLTLTFDMKKRLDAFELSIKEEEEEREKEIRNAFNNSLKELEEELANQKAENAQRLGAERDSLQKSFSLEMEEMLAKERESNKNLLSQRLQSLKEEMSEQANKEVEDLKAQLSIESKTRLKTVENEFKKEIEEIERERKKYLEEKRKLELLELNKVKDSNSALESLKKEMAENLENQKQKLNAEHVAVINKLQEEHNNKMEILLMDFKLEEENMRREQQENLGKLKEKLNSDHEAEVKKLREIIERRNKYLEEQEKQAKQEMAKIEQENSKCEQLQRQVELLSMKLREGRRMLEETRAAKPDDRVFEELRCKKRILEDKYRTLKEKYVKLKSEAKANAEKRPTKKVAEGGKGGTGSETDRSTSQRMAQKGDNSLAPTSLSQEATPNGVAKTGPNSRKQDVCIVTVGPTPTKEKVSFPVPVEAPDAGSDVGEEVLSGATDNGLRPPATPKALPSSPLSPAGPGAGDLSSSITSPPEDSHTGGTASSSGTERPPRPAGFEPRKRKQFRLKSSSTSRLCKGRDMSPVENLRKQLKKLEDLEDLFPVTTHTDMYLRYPFTDSGQFGSSELEFFRHRIHMERDSVRRAKEFLRQQRQSFQRRQRELRQKQHQDQIQLHQQNPKTQMEMLHSSFGKEERELTDMEVSLHRTRSLLGEKIIRLRHLEQSLQRATLASAYAAAAADGNAQGAEEPAAKRTSAIPPHIERTSAGGADATLSDLSSHSGSSGFSSTELGTETTGRANINDGQARNYQESSAIVQSLEILNSEIRSIWEVLSKQHGLGNIKMGPPQLVLNPPPVGWPPMPNTQTMRPPLSEQLQSFRNQHHLAIGRGSPSRPTSLAERTQSLRTWLRQARMDSTTTRANGGLASSMFCGFYDLRIDESHYSESVLQWYYRTAAQNKYGNSNDHL